MILAKNCEDIFTFVEVVYGILFTVFIFWRHCRIHLLSCSSEELLHWLLAQQGDLFHSPPNAIRCVSTK